VAEEERKGESGVRDGGGEKREARRVCAAAVLLKRWCVDED